MRGMKGAEYYSNRVRRSMKARPAEWQKRFRETERHASSKAWRDDRELWDYMNFFEEFFPNHSLLGTLVEMHGNKPLRILDEGIGQGIAGAELKKELASFGVKSTITGLTLSKGTELAGREAAGEIDEVIVGKAEGFIPKSPFDLILSVTGSLTYTLPSARKDHLLRFAHSLKKGGILLACIQLDIRNFKDKGKFLQQDMEGIVKAFNKRGFEAKFRFRPIELSMSQMMEDPDSRNHFNLILYAKKRGGTTKHTLQTPAKPARQRFFQRIRGWLSR